MKNYRDMYDVIVPRIYKKEVCISLVSKGWKQGTTLKRRAFFHKPGVWLMVKFV